MLTEKLEELDKRQDSEEFHAELWGPLEDPNQIIDYLLFHRSEFLNRAFTKLLKYIF